MNISIRKAILSDLESVISLNLKLFENEQIWHPTNRREWCNEPSGKAYFSKRILEDDGVVFLAIDGEEIIGYLCGGWLRRYPFRKERLFAEVENMYVEQEYRSQGIGQMLISSFEKWAKEKGVEKVIVECVYENEKGLHFYDKNGYKSHSVKLEKKISDD